MQTATPAQSALLDELIQRYQAKKEAIRARLVDFKRVGETADDARLFEELVFCICTPQSAARRAEVAMTRLHTTGILYNGTALEIGKILEQAGVRFPMNKGRFIDEARYHLMRDGFGMRALVDRHKGNPRAFREWLVNNIKGLGLKEASHFLRNIGLGEELAILDRHILKNLYKYGAIEEALEELKLTSKKYLEIEQSMKEFAQRAGIPFAELDLLFWSEETGEIFK